MRKKLLAAGLLMGSLSSFAQDLPGYRTGNYSGVNGVFSNPANVADNRYRFDFNLFSVNTFLGNNQAAFQLKTASNLFTSDSLENQFINSNAKATSGSVNVSVIGPSLMLATGKKSGIALTTRFRTIANVTDIDGRLVKQIEDDADAGLQFPYKIESNQNMRLTVNSWTEFGLSYGRVLAVKGMHYLKGGLSVKYLAGVANAYINVARLQATSNKDVSGDVYLSNTTGRIATGFGGVSISDFDASNALKGNNKGFGADLGLVYELRTEEEGNRTSDGQWRKDVNPYKLKVGVALQDIGRLKYRKDAQRSGAYNIDITGNEKFYPSELKDEEIDNYNSFFQSRPQYFIPDASNSATTYSVALPSTLQLDLDYHIHRGIYTSFSAQVPVGAQQEANSRTYKSFTLTPRFESRALGLFIPLNYNNLTNVNAGLSLRLGPLFVGSGSILTAAFKDSKQADVFVGLHFGGLQKNKYKKEQKNK